MREMKYAIVVAHADDEAIWCASLPLRYAGRWTVICCSIPDVEQERGLVKFFNSCEVLGAEAVLFNVPEAGMDRPLTTLGRLELEGYDHIFTHNEAGEYGHPHHIQIHKYIKENWGHKKLTFFGYRTRGIGNSVVNLSLAEIEKKLEAIKCYNNMRGSVPYYEIILSWFHRQPNLRLVQETFEGDLP